MAGYGGAIKLTGESEYKRALSQITQSLRVVSSEMKSTASAFAIGDKSQQDVANSAKTLKTSLEQQKTALASLKSQLSTMTAEYQKTGQKHQQLVSEYEREKAKLEEIGRTLGTSSKEYQEQQKVVTNLAQEVAKSEKAYDAQGRALNDMKIKTANAETQCNQTAQAVDKLGNEAEETGKQAKSSGDGFTVMKGILANLASSAITACIDGLKNLGLKIIDIGKQSYQAYSDYEQLVGGVDTLFGKSSKTIQKYASEAYKTAGMSANQYMEQVTGFSATLLQGLGGNTEKAAKVANMAMVDMSDNANKMGTSMTMIQNAYQGFAKDNYTMLDNLKLGYGGTQAEMARLINDSGVLGKSIKVNAKTVKDVPFDKVIEAIHKIQQNIGITGTTSKEASTTIEGSFNSVKSAWQNLLAGMGDQNANVGQLVKNFVDTLSTAIKNSAPLIRNIVKGMAETVKALWNEALPELKLTFPELKPVISSLEWLKTNAPIIASGVAGIATAFLSFKAVTIVSTAITAFKGLATAIKGAEGAQAVLNVVMSANPIGAIVAAIAGLVVAFTVLWNTSDKFRNFWKGLWSGIKSVASTAVNAIAGFFTKTIPNAIKFMLDIYVGLPIKIATYLGKAVVKVAEFAVSIGKKGLEAGKTFLTNVVSFFKNLPSNLWTWLKNGITKITTFATEIATKAKTAGGNFLKNIVSFFKQLPSKLWEFLKSGITKVATFATDIASKAKSAGNNFLKNIISFFKNLPSNIWTWLKNTISKVDSFASNLVKKGVEAGKNFSDKLINGLKHLPSEMLNIGKNIVRGIWNGIAGMGNWISGKVSGFAKGIVKSFKKSLGIHSPSTVMRDEVGVNLAKGVVAGVKKEHANTVNELTKESEKTLKEYYAKRKRIEDELSKAHTESRKQSLKKQLESVNASIEKEQEKHSKNLTKQSAKLSDELVKTAKTRVKQLENANKMSLADEVGYWAEIASSCKKGSDAYKTAVDSMNKAKNSLKDKVNDLNTSYTASIQKVNETLEKNIAELEKKYSDAIDQRKDAITSQVSLFDAVKENDTQDKETLINNLSGQVGALQDWDDTLTSLEGRLGGNTEFLKELDKQGLSSLGNLKALNSMTDDELATYVNLWSEKEAIAKDRAEKENKDLKEQTDKQIEDLKAQAEKQITTLSKTYKKKLKKLGITIKTSAKDIGVNTAKGLKSGFLSQEDNITYAVNSMMERIVKSAKRRMKIHSPSKVWAEIGDYMAQGLGVGFTDEMKDVTRDINNSLPTSIDSKSSSISATSNSFDSMVSAFKVALSQMKIEMDDEEMGKFVDKTVTRLVYV